MKIQRLICLTCNAVFAVTVDENASPSWYKDVAKYLANGNTRIETIERPEGGSFGDKRISKCCGKKKKAVINPPVK